jgi:peptidyl-prolyl cis-trans isomerase B (cyclophilin B)
MKSIVSIFAAALVLGVAVGNAQESKTENSETNNAGAKAASKDENKSAATNEVAVIKTSEGELLIEFWPDVAPKTVENFKALAQKKFYDGTCFHRIIDGFMIQGGDPNTKDSTKEAQWGQGGPGYNTKGETNNRSDRRHTKGVISMAHSGHPDSAGSQFFICLGNARSLDGGYTTFGKLIKGDDVLTRLGKSPVKPNPFDPHHEVSRPVKRVGLDSIRIVPADSIK